MATELWAIGLVIAGTLIGAFGPIYMKKGSKKFNLNIMQQLKNHHLILGCVFYLVSTMFFVPSLRGGELSVLYPFVGLIYVWVCALSVKMLNEKMNSVKWTGIACIIIGVALIGLGS